MILQPNNYYISNNYNMIFNIKKDYNNVLLIEKMKSIIYYNYVY